MAGRDFELDIRHNLKTAVARLEVRSQKVINLATVRALNRTATSVRAEASRQINSRYRIKIAAIKKQLRIKKADRFVQVAEIIASGRRIPLIEFAARQTRKGVTVRVTSTRKLVRHAFIATMPSGHRGVFARKGERRLPIQQLFAMSLPQAFTQRYVVAAMKRVGRERFRVEFDRELKFRSGLTNG